MNKAWHTRNQKDIIKELNSSETGLTAQEAKQRLEKDGPNKLSEGKKRTLLGIFFAQFGDLMIWVLIGAAIVSAVAPLLEGGHPEFTDAAIILVVVLLNAVLGTIQESKAEAALDALKQMAAPGAKVLRGGNLLKIPASELVVGDIISLEAGDSVPADIRIIESASLKIEESALTGESVPVDKSSVTIGDEKAPLGDRLCMGFLGTSVTYGRATAIVVETGMNTQMGAIASHLASTEKETTPLQKKLNQISNIISIGVLGIAVLVFALIMLSKTEKVNDAFMTSVALAVAAIPEGMVAVVTIVLAMGMRRMAGRGAIIRRLPAVETLGSTQVICSDKTGTLTQNKMTVVKLWTERSTPSEKGVGDNVDPLFFEAMFHCNDSRLDDSNNPIGDPTETAFITHLLTTNLRKAEDIRNRTRAGEIPFDSERKLSTVAIKHNGAMRIFVKGAPDVLLSRCKMSAGLQVEAEKQNEEMAKKALRVLAYGYKDVEKADFNNAYEVENGLTFIGLAGMIDPARPEAKAAIAVCRKAGIVPVMITGDHKITAVAIATDLGILSANDSRRAITGAELELMSEADLDRDVEHIGVYARVAPEHKSRIVAAWQRKGKIVSMTGDGVNDAPALKSADIGVGMGITGTDVSKGASDMVLTDDNFATIVTAVGEGRRIFDNIHKTVRFLLSSNAGEVLAILITTLLGWKLLLPVHILWINLVTDTFPALALGVEPAEKDIMERKPRDQKTPFFTGREWGRVVLTGAAEATLAIIAFIIGGGTENQSVAMTMAFLTLALSQLFAAVGFQSERHSAFSMRFKEHKPLWLAFFGSALLQLVVILVPPIRDLFELSMLDWLQWVQVVALCLLMLLFIEGQKLVARIINK